MLKSATLARFSGTRPEPERLFQTLRRGRANLMPTSPMLISLSLTSPGPLASPDLYCCDSNVAR